MRPDPVIAIAGSRALDPGIAPRLLIRFLANVSQAQPAATVLLRRARSKPPGPFEEQVAGLCDLVGLKLEWCYPIAEEIRKFSDADGEPITEHLPLTGREQTFARDMDMIDRADLVLCFWHARETGDEHSGTVALANKAVDQNKVVYAYEIDGDQLVNRVGEHDPTNVWEDKVPAPA